ncbi:thiamine phosphate synthase [Sphingomonas nostoxanthinifaciens]|nr:thiamine phosphate synthase [Sphingomonas nostoxanthinifaciens]
MGDALWVALARLPRGGGVIFRHYRTPLPERRVLFAHVRTIARARRLVLVLAGDPRIAAAWRADGVHGAHGGRGLLHTAPVHDRRALIAAARAGADLVLLSPVFPTRSHPGAVTLGAIRFGLAARDVRPPVIALGGMTAARFRRVGPLGAYGWAAIDAWSADTDAIRT